MNRTIKIAGLAIVAALSVLAFVSIPQRPAVELTIVDGDPDYPALSESSVTNVTYSLGIHYAPSQIPMKLVIEHGMNEEITWSDGEGYRNYTGPIPLNIKGGTVRLHITYLSEGIFDNRVYVEEA
jgi:hypothetical protein